MSKIKIGIICPSEIAFRRFLPALMQDDRFLFVGISIASAKEWYDDNTKINIDENKRRENNEREKAQTFINSCGGVIFDSYISLISSDEIEAVYLPLPPALHYKWALLALQHGKHVFVEKPSTMSIADTQVLVMQARRKGLALHENYMFIYHNQIKAIDDIVAGGEIGDIRLYRVSFGFPRRKQNDFRYNKALGGGALIDAGGYTIKYASYLLGPSAKITTAHLNFLSNYDVDIFGSATMINNKGMTAQLAFGMDNDYKCEIEIWGSKGTIRSNRILTAPAGFEPECIIKKDQYFETRKLPADDTFRKSISRFYDCICNSATRENEYNLIESEASLLSEFEKISKQ